MKIIYLILFATMSFCYQNNGTSFNEYSSFREKYKSANSVNKGERFCLQELNDKNLKQIDTSIISKVKLIDRSFTNHKFGLKTLNEINCKYITGFYENAYDCYLISFYTTSVGDGNKMLQVKTFNKNGIPIDSLLIPINFRHDYDIDPIQYFTITDKNQIILEDIKNIYGLTDSTTTTSNLELIKENRAVYYYQIENSGQITKIK